MLPETEKSVGIALFSPSEKQELTQHFKKHLLQKFNCLREMLQHSEC